MKMTQTEFEALRHRVSQAYYQGYKIANIADYIEAVGGGNPPPDVEPFSTAHLYCLLQQIDSGNLHVAKVVEKETPLPSVPSAGHQTPTPTPVDILEAVRAVVGPTRQAPVAEETPVKAATSIQQATETEVTVKKPKKKA